MATPADVAAAARAAHERIAALGEQMDEARAERDRLIRQLRADHGWSYGMIAKQLGVSRGLIAVICRDLVGRTG